MNEWFAQNFWITCLLIFVMISYVYNKVFRTRRLPLLKTLIVYILLAVSALMLTLFQVLGPQIPIVPSLAFAILLMMILRIRYFIEGRRKKNGASSTK
ncbi:YlaH-like family protein [Paenibacillus sp. FJAT-26967]|uniref:YlaH-like family protein n=1 Tax=Paenibacillus sp. FJAT-26967 TaxID=1729690 RepID=UPI000837D07F|nr:YlaH-like family protein [Paenibacillus sp. FJAT-26967]